MTLSINLLFVTAVLFRDITLKIVELESNFQREAVQSLWKRLRESWLEECHIASTLEEVSSLLLELESNTTWEVVTDEWQENRENWVQQMYEFIE